MINHLQAPTLKQAIKKEIKDIVGQSNIDNIKSILKK